MNAPAAPDSTAPSSIPVRQRRAWLYAAVAGVAASTGLGVAWWTGAHRDGTSGQGKAALWNASFTAPDGTSVRMQSFAGRPLLVNFWATWCPPCIEELPLLDRFFQENRGNGWQVIGIAADRAAAVGAFLRRVPVHFPVGLAGMEGIELSKSLGNLGGGLPFTVVLGSKGDIVQRKIGQVTPEDLSAWSRVR